MAAVTGGDGSHRWWLDERGQWTALGLLALELAMVPVRSRAAARGWQLWGALLCVVVGRWFIVETVLEMLENEAWEMT